MLAAGLEDSLQYKVSLVCFRSQRDWAKGALQLCDLNHTGVLDDRHKHTLSLGAFFGRRNSIKKTWLFSFSMSEKTGMLLQTKEDQNFNYYKKVL